MGHKSKIELDISLDKNKIPEEIKWSAEDGGISKEEAKAMFLSIWDDNNKETLKIDLWVKDMSLEDMNTFFYQTFMSMSETFFRATNDEKMTADMRDFCNHFAEKLNIEKK